MIYLFTNRKGGLAFIETFARACAQHGQPGCVVLSSRNSLQLSPFFYFKHILGHRLLAFKLRKRPWLSVLIVKDINAAGFRQRVNPGDCGLVGGFDQIFRAELIQRFDSLVNMHTSLLPYYRGPIPTYWVLQNRETQSGITLHRITEEIDAGEILYQEVVDIEPGVTEPELRQSLWQLGQNVLEKWLHHRLTGTGFSTRVVDADSVYRVKVDYRSYPHKELETEKNI